MKIISPLLLGLLLIAPRLQASEAEVKAVAASSEEIRETEHLCRAINALNLDSIITFLPSEKITPCMEQEIDRVLSQHKDPEHARILLLRPAIHRNKALLKKLLPHMSIQRFRDVHGFDPIFNTRDSETMQLLLNHKANINVRDRGETRLISLCRSLPDDSRRQCIKLLLAQPGIDVNAQDSHGSTALQILIENEHHKYSDDRFPIAKKLLEHNADPYIETTDYIVRANNVFDTLTTQSGYDRGCTWGYFELNLAPELVRETLALCVAQRPRRIQGLHNALAPHLTKDTAGVVIGYLPEGCDEEQAKKAKTDSTALTKTTGVETA